MILEGGFSPLWRKQRAWPELSILARSPKTGRKKIQRKSARIPMCVDETSGGGKADNLCASARSKLRPIHAVARKTLWRRRSHTSAGHGSIFFPDPVQSI